MAKAKSEKSGLKVLAADAKSRLKNGFYSSGADNLCKDYYMLVRSSFECKQKADKERKFYDKVVKLLEGGGTATNPILQLVEPGEIGGLSYSARQRYLLEIARKFNKIKSEIEASHYS